MPKSVFLSIHRINEKSAGGTVMNGNDFLTALALLLIFEGLMPFANPSKWQAALRSISELPPSKVRILGFVSMLAGLLLLYLLS